MSSLDLSLDTLDLHLASIESADLNSLPTSIFAPTELPAWTKVDLPANTKTVETEPIFLDDFKWDGLEHLLNAKPIVHDSSNTRVSVFERFDLGKITDDELSLFGEGGNNRFSFYVGKVSPPKVNTVSLMKSTTTPVNTSSSKTLSQMTHGASNKENQSASTNTAPPESPRQPEVSKNTTATLRKSTKSSTPTRNSLSGLPSGIPASTAARNSPRHSISRIPSSSSSPSLNSTSKKQVPSDKPAAAIKPTPTAQTSVQPITTAATSTAFKKPAIQAPSIPARTISPTPSTQAQPIQPQATPQPSSGIPAPSVNTLKKSVKKSSDIPKAAAVLQKSQAAPTPASTQSAAVVQPVLSVPIATTQPADKDPFAQLLAKVKILEDTIATMKKDHKQEVSALRTRLTLVEQKLQASIE